MQENGGDLKQKRQRRVEGVVTINDALDRVLDRFEDTSSGTGGVPSGAMKTNMTDLDELVGGLRPGSLVVISGRPMMGKSAFISNVAENISLEHRDKGSVLFFSVDKTETAVMFHILASLSAVSLNDIDSGDMTDEHLERLSASGAMLSELDSLLIDTSPRLTPADVIKRSKAVLADRGKVSAVCIDSLQLMSCDRPLENRNAELSYITRELKRLAKELDCPVVITSQLNRQLVNRADKRPFLHDLRDSGSIEQDADLILFMYRDQVYNPDGAMQGYAEVIVGKNSFGVGGTVLMQYSPEYGRFRDVLDKTHPWYTGDEHYY